MAGYAGVMQDVADQSGKSGGTGEALVPSATAVPSCPGCGYTFVGLRFAKCPECGYVPDAEELAGAELRLAYEELTSVTRWIWAGCAAGLLVISAIMDLGSVGWAVFFGGLLAFFGIGMYYFAKDCPVAYQRLVRLIWIGLAGWMLLPWFSSLATMVLFTLWDERFNGQRWTSLARMDSGAPLAACFIGGVLGTIVGPLMWKKRWRRVARASGLPKRAINLANEQVAWRAAFIPGMIVFVLPSGVALLIWIMDSLRINWY